MSPSEIEYGVDLAKKALYFAIFANGEQRAGECREAIEILFGEEIDKKLSDEFAKGEYL